MVHKESPRACIIEITDGILYFWNILSIKKSFEVCFGRISWAKSVGERQKKNGFIFKWLVSAVYKVSTSPKRHVSNALRGNVFAKSLLYMDVPGEESFRKHLLVTAHFVPRVSQTLTSEIFAEGVWPLHTDFSCFLNWLKPKLTFRALSHKSYWPSISWDFCNKQIKIVYFMPHGQYCWVI